MADTLTDPWIYCPACGAITGRGSDVNADLCPACGYELSPTEFIAQRQRATLGDEIRKNAETQNVVISNYE